MATSEPNNNLPESRPANIMRHIRRESVRILILIGVSRIFSLPFLHKGIPGPDWVAQTLHRTDEVFIIGTTGAMIGMAIRIEFEGYVTRLRQSPWQTVWETFLCLLPFVPGTITLAIGLWNVVRPIMFGIIRAINRSFQEYSRELGRSEERTKTIRILEEMHDLSPKQRATIIARLSQSAVDSESDREKR